MSITYFVPDSACSVLMLDVGKRHSNGTAVRHMCRKFLCVILILVFYGHDDGYSAVKNENTKARFTEHFICRSYW